MGGAPPMGGPPMGGPMGAPGPAEPPPIPKYANVWDVLEAILQHKPLDHDKKLQAEKQRKMQQPPPMPPMPGQDMGGMMPPGTQPPMGAAAGQPHLMS